MEGGCFEQQLPPGNLKNSEEKLEKSIQENDQNKILTK